MEINSFFASHLQNHFKKLLIIFTATASIYLVKKYLEKRNEKSEVKKKKTLKEFPTVEEIQKFIEDLPFEAVASGKPTSLQDLLGELSEFSEDEDWKELINSVQNMYKERDNKLPVIKETVDDTGSVISIYEDPNVISLNELSPRHEKGALNTIDDSPANPETVIDQSFENMGNGDVGADAALLLSDKEETLLDLSNRDDGIGQGDLKDPLYYYSD